MAEDPSAADQLQAPLGGLTQVDRPGGPVPGLPDGAGGGPPSGPALEEGQKAKKDRKDKNKKLRDQRELKPWDRCRALTDALKTAQDLLEFGDRKVRFGLVVIGAINLAVFGAAFRAQSVAPIPAGWRSWIVLYLAIYAVVLVYGVRYAISALRPRIQPTQGSTEQSPGLHFHEDVLRRTPADYEKAWLNLPAGELSSLLVRQIISLAHINHAKFSALQRMYASINLMVIMAGGLLVIAVLVAFEGGDAARSETASEQVASPGNFPDFNTREYKLMLLPPRFADAGRPTEDSIARAIVAYWAMVGAETLPGISVRTAAIEQRVAQGPSRHRLLQFFDASVRSADSDCPGEAAGPAFLYDCKGLVLRSRIEVRPFEPARGFEIDDRAARPVEITLKSRSAANLGAAMGPPITAITQAGGAPISVESKVEKDMTAGRTTYGQSCKVEMSPAQASSLFSGQAPQEPGVAVPRDLAELQRLFAAPQLVGAENRPILPVKDYAAYEQVYKIPDAIEFPDGFLATVTMSFWYDLKKELKVVEASWRIDRMHRAPAERFLPVVVGASEQFLDHLVGVSQRRGWFNSEAPTKKSQALAEGGG